MPLIIRDDQPFQRAAQDVETALSAMAALLEAHSGACVCRFCVALQQGRQALESLALLGRLVDAHTREEWRTQQPGPFTALTNACMLPED